MEGQIDYLVVEFNRIEDEKFQSQLIAKGHYMINEDESSNSCHEHVLVTNNLRARKLWITMRRKKEMSTWSLLGTLSELSPHQL